MYVKALLEIRRPFVFHEGRGDDYSADTMAPHPRMAGPELVNEQPETVRLPSARRKQKWKLERDLIFTATANRETMHAAAKKTQYGMKSLETQSFDLYLSKVAKKKPSPAMSVTRPHEEWK